MSEIQHNWQRELPEEVLSYLQGVFNKLNSGEHDTLHAALNAVAAPSKEVQRDLEKLAALEAGGVDNWEWYGDSLAELFVQWDAEDEEESSNG